MRILVTGGAGFIGSHLVDALIKRRHRVSVIDNLATGKKENLNPKARFYQADIRDNLAPIFAKEKSEIVYHLAAQSSVAVSLRDPIKDAQINILGSLNLFKYCCRSRVNRCHSRAELAPAKARGGNPVLPLARHSVKKVIFTSSGGVMYGQARRDPLRSLARQAKKLPTPEIVLPNPQCPYGVAKLAVEKYLTALQIPHTILRLANVYGPRQDPKGEAGVIAIFIGKVLKGEPPVIFGTGRQTRDYVYVSDVVRALLLAIHKKTPVPINIGTGQETSVKQILRFIDCRAKPIFQPARPGELQSSCLDSRLAKRVLRWQPEIQLKRGITMTKKYFQASRK